MKVKKDAKVEGELAVDLIGVFRGSVKSKPTYTT